MAKKGKAISAKALTFPEVVRNMQKRIRKERLYVKKTGNCPVCKKNKVFQDTLRCASCLDAATRAIKALQGTSGFMGVLVAPKPKGDKQ